VRQVEGRDVRVTHQDKILYPATGFAKGDVLDYYERIASVMVPYLAGRTVTLKRYPDGVAGEVFYQKNCPKTRPAWVHTAAVWSDTNRRKMSYCVIDDAASLLWAANLAALELHVSLARAAEIERPTSIIFDLDPGPPAGLIECLWVASWLRKHCERLGLQLLPKVSGSKGLHLHIPLNTEVTYDDTKPFALELAERLEADHPELVVANMRRELRQGRVLVDWSQNEEHKTTVCVYSLRGREHPTISTPVTWEEIDAALTRGDAQSLSFEAADVFARLDRYGDLYRPLLELHQSLPH